MTGRRNYTDIEIFEAVLGLARWGPVSQAALARQLGCSPAGLHRRLHRLQDAGVLDLGPVRLRPEAISWACDQVEIVTLLRVSRRLGRAQATPVSKV